MRKRRYRSSSGRSQVWKKAGRSKRGDPGKKVYEIPVSEICSIRGIEPMFWEDLSDDVLLEYAGKMKLDIKGSVWPYRVGSNGTENRGYCLRDTVDPNRGYPWLPKVYQAGDKVRMVIPPGFSDGYAMDITGASKWERKA